LPILFTCLDVAPSGRLLAAGTTTGTVYVFDIDKQRQLAKVAALTQPVSSVAFGDELSLMVGVAPSEPADQAGPDTAPMTVATAAGPAGALRYRFRWPDGPALARDAEPPSDAQLPSVEFSGSSTVATPGKTAPTPDARPRRELLAEVRSIPLAKSPGLPAPGAPTTEPAPGMYPGMSPAARPVPDFCFLLLPDGRRAVSRGKDEQLHVVDFSNGQSVGTLENSREAEPVWSDGDNALAVTGAKGPTGPTQPSAFEKWEVATGRWLGRAYFFKAAPAQAAPAMPPGTMPEMMMPSGPPAPSPRGASCWAVFPSKEYGQYAVLADGDTASVVKLDRFARPAATSKPSKKTPPPPSCSFQKSISVPGNGISALAALSDGRTFLAGCNDGSISVCDAPGGRIVRTWAKQSSRITVLVVSADGTKVISLAASTPASGMSAPGRKRSRAAEEFDMSAPSMAEMPRYGALPTPGPSRLWNIADGTEIHTLARPASVVALAPDASLAVSAAGKDLSLWELKGGEEIARVLLHGNAQRVEFLPDGIHVLALSDESLTFWRLHASIRPKPVTPPNAETGGAEPAEEAGAKRPPDKKS
jgi:WD40 repeat protein